MAQSGKIALVTGASSGIGRAFAKRLASDGYDLVLTGRRKELLDALAAELTGAHGVRVEIVTAELSDEADVGALVEKVKSLENLAMLVNNAGFGTVGFFHEESAESQGAMVKCHVLAPVLLTHAAIPNMIKAGHGAIINVSSVRAFSPGMTSAAYSGTKSFVNVFSESVALELAGTGIRVQALCPGYTVTDFHQRIGMNTAGKNHGIVRWMNADDVVDVSLRDLARGRVISVPGWWNKILVFIQKFVPTAIVQRFAPGTGGGKTR